jgi:large subunit GTPase 1
MEEPSKPKLVSVLEQNSLEEFVALAQLSAKTFEAERGTNIVYYDSQLVYGDDLKNSVAMVNVFLGEKGEKSEQVKGHYAPLTIPRRPIWDRSMTGHEINQKENMAFLEWRRDIATKEQNNISLAITPFEKNVDIWRQLWRVIENCDLLIQVSLN